MSTVTVTTTPTILDAGTAFDLSLVNSGSLSIHVEISGGSLGLLYHEILRPNQQVTVYPHGYPVSAFTDSGTSSVDVTLGDNPQLNASREAAQDALAAGALVKTANLSDVANAATARTNLGLGTAATHPDTDFLTPSVASATYPTVVEHGATAGTARPSGAVRVFWRGTVIPTNIAQWDRFIDVTTPSAPVEKICTSVGPVVLASLGGGVSAAPRMDVLANRGTAAAHASTYFLATDQAGGTYYYSDGSTWTQLAPGVSNTTSNEVSYTEITSAVTGIGGTWTDLPGLTASFTPVAGRIYKLIFDSLWYGSAATTNIAVQFIDTTSGGTTSVGLGVDVCEHASQDKTLHFEKRFSGLSGAKTYQAQAKTNATGTVTIDAFPAYPAWFQVVAL